MIDNTYKNVRDIILKFTLNAIYNALEELNAESANLNLTL